jgi:hypothetical protein
MARYGILMGALAVLVGAVYLRRNRVSGDPSTRPLRQPIADYRAEVARYGEVLGVPVPDERIDQVIKAVARDSVDVFGSKEAAMRFLLASPIEDALVATDVLKTSGLSRVLSRIDGLRFGAFS